MSITLREILTQFELAKKRTGQTSYCRFREIERFVEYQEERKNPFLTYDAVLNWHSLRSQNLSAYSLQESYGILHSFSRWAHLIDGRNAELPSRKRRLNGRRTPVILNDQQVGEIIHHMKQACKFRPLTSATYSTLVGLLYVTGMRVSEALINLSDADVNLDERYIYVSPGKVDRDRYIPISDSTAVKLHKYRQLREKQFPGLTDRFFRVHTGLPKTAHVFRKVFNRVTADLGYRSHDQKNHVATSLVPHDLRHSFATNALHRFHAEGLDLESEIPKLSTIMGHYSVRETYWYIESIPELLAQILNKEHKNAI